MKRLLSPVTALGILLSSVSSPFAQIATGTLDMKITVLDGCVVRNGGTLDFGTIVDLTDDVDGFITRPDTAPIKVECPPGTTVSVGLDEGQNSDGTWRRMKLDTGAGPEYINYAIFRRYGDGNWGNTPGVDTEDYNNGPGGEDWLWPRGFIPGGQPMPSAGTYTDTVQITVYY